MCVEHRYSDASGRYTDSIVTENLLRLILHLGLFTRVARHIVLQATDSSNHVERNLVLIGLMGDRFAACISLDLLLKLGNRGTA